MRQFKQPCAELRNTYAKHFMLFLTWVSPCVSIEMSVGNRNFLWENDLGLFVAHIKYPTRPINTDPKMAPAEMPALTSSLFFSVRKRNKDETVEWE